MIIVPGWVQGAVAFYEVGPGTFEIPEKKKFESEYSKKGYVERYVAKSTSAILVEMKDTIHITVGNEVTDNVLKNIMGYALKQRKPLALDRCETLSVLRAVDDMVMLCNGYMEATTPDELDFDPEI